MKWEVYINGIEHTNQTLNLKLERKRSRLYTASGDIIGFAEVDYNAMKKTDEITIRSVKSPKNNFQGEFSKLSYDALGQKLSFTAYNFPIKLRNITWTDAPKTWTDETIETIINYLLQTFGEDDLYYNISNDDLKNLVIGFRIENEPIWNAITRLLKQVGATWYAHPAPWSATHKKFTQEKLYFDYDFYTTTEEATAYTERILSKEYDRIINYIKVLGSGEGTAQLASINLHATTIRSHLAEALAADGTTIVLEDASDFPKTSNTPIQIGNEILLYESKVGNTLQNCLRARNATVAYAHNKGIEVYSAEYKSDCPQSGSSIEENGKLSSVFTDKTIGNQNTLDFFAQDIIDKRHDIKEVVKLGTVHVDDLDVTVGDKFTVEDKTDTIYEFSYQDSNLLIALTGGDTYEPFIDQITETIESEEAKEEEEEEVEEEAITWKNDIYTIVASSSRDSERKYSCDVSGQTYVEIESRDETHIIYLNIEDFGDASVTYVRIYGVFGYSNGGEGWLDSYIKEDGVILEEQHYHRLGGAGSGSTGIGHTFSGLSLKNKNITIETRWRTDPHEGTAYLKWNRATPASPYLPYDWEFKIDGVIETEYVPYTPIIGYWDFPVEENKISNINDGDVETYWKPKSWDTNPTLHIYPISGYFLATGLRIYFVDKPISMMLKKNINGIYVDYPSITHTPSNGWDKITLPLSYRFFNWEFDFPSNNFKIGEIEVGI